MPTNVSDILVKFSERDLHRQVAAAAQRIAAQPRVFHLVGKECLDLTLRGRGELYRDLVVQMAGDCVEEQFGRCNIASFGNGNLS